MTSVHSKLLERRYRWDQYLRAGAIELFREHLQRTATSMATNPLALAADEWLWVEETFWCRASREGLGADVYDNVAETIENFAAHSLMDRMLKHLDEVVPSLADQVCQLAASATSHCDRPHNFAFEQAIAEASRQLALIIARLRSLSGERRACIFPADPFVLSHSAPDPLSTLLREQASVRSEWAGPMGVGDCWGQAHADSLEGTPRLVSTVGGKIERDAAGPRPSRSVSTLVIAEKAGGSISADLRMRIALMTASQLAEEYISANPRVCMSSAGNGANAEKSWCPKTRQQFRSAARLATKFFGIKPFVQVTHREFVDFYKKLLQIPVDHHTHLADHSRTIDQIVLRGRESGIDPMSPSTVTRHINNLRLLHTWIGTAFELPLIQWGTMITWRGRERIVSDILSIEQIEELFHLPIWTGAASFRGTPAKGNRIWHSAFYWVPPLLWYTGITRDATCGLKLDNVTELDGHDCIQVPAGGSRGFERFIPLHPELIRLGFLDYVEALRREGETMLFPELRRASDQSAADVFSSRCWRPIRQALPSLPLDCAAGAIRDAAERALLDLEAFDEKVHDLFGIMGSSEADLRYTRITPPSRLIAIVKIIPVTTAHIEARPIRLLPRHARQRTPARIVPTVQERLYQEQALRALLPDRAANKNDPNQPPTEVA